MALPSQTKRFPLVPVLALLSASVFISYVDRGNLSLAAPALKQELGLTATQLGVLLSGFFWSYTLLLSVSGWIVDRFDVKWVLAAGFVLWSLATAAAGAVQGFTLLLWCRLALGVGESVTFPAYSKILARHVAQENRGFANAVIMSGMMAGPAVGTFVLGNLIGQYGWRPVFVVLGLASLAWVLPWALIMPANRGLPETNRGAAIALKHLLQRRSFWGAALGHFCCNYHIYFMISWLPYYLVNERHKSMTAMAFEGAMYYAAYALASPIAGLVADLLIRRGAAVTRVRKTSVVLGHVVTAAGALGLLTGDEAIIFASLLAMGVGCGICGSNIYTFAQTLAGPVAAGKWTGWQNCLANVAGIVVPPLTGLIVDRTGKFQLAFILAALVSLLGAASWAFIVGELKPVDAGAKPAAEPVGLAKQSA